MWWFLGRWFVGAYAGDVDAVVDGAVVVVEEGGCRWVYRSADARSTRGAPLRRGRHEDGLALSESVGAFFLREVVVMMWLGLRRKEGPGGSRSIIIMILLLKEVVAFLLAFLFVSEVEVAES